MDKILSAWLVGLGIYALSTAFAPRIVSALSLPSALIHPTILAASVLLAAWGWDVFFESRSRRTLGDRQEQDTEIFLQRLSRTLANRGNLAQALDDLANNDNRVLADPDPYRVLADLALRWRTEAMTIVASSARIAGRYGGSVDVIIEQVVKHIGRQRRQRFQRRLEETAMESTVLILSVAPFGLLAIFAVSLPTFYRVLATTVVGHGVILFLGLITAAVLWGLAWYIRMEGR